MKDTITLAELRQTELYRKEQTRPLREFLTENIDVLKLADELEEFSGDGAFKYYIEIAAMLRQQQAEIERLKALCITYIDDEWSGTSSYQAKIDEVNNERK